MTRSRLRPVAIAAVATIAILPALATSATATESAAQHTTHPAAKTVQVPLWDVSRITGQGTFTLVAKGVSGDGLTTNDITETNTVVIKGSPLSGKKALVTSSKLGSVPINATQTYTIAGTATSDGTTCNSDEKVTKTGATTLDWPLTAKGLPVQMGVGTYTSPVNVNHLSGITWNDGWTPIFELGQVVNGNECTPPGDPESKAGGTQRYVATKKSLTMTTRGSGTVMTHDNTPATLTWEYTYTIPRGGWKTMPAAVTKPIAN